ncbi:MAG: alpha-amylase family protein [Puniceicoccaceae bacterium]
MTTHTSFRNRQIHLDFHTSPFIGDVCADFDAEAFADKLVEAHVNSVTVFAKCHHGQCYYPTKTGVQHPALHGRDILGEQLEALKKRGIRCPIYTTIVWEEDVAQKHPEWHQLKKNGSFAVWQMATDRTTEQAGYWKFNDFSNPDYQDYFEAHVRELLENYDVDGLFIDILFFHPEGTWSDSCRKLREELNIWTDNHEAHARIEWEAQRRFMEKFNRITKGIQPNAGLFYNQHNSAFIDHTVGFGSLAKLQSQLEVESLPSGFWGYQHFPRMARQIWTMGKPWLGMTGRFQKQWGDFGGIKPVPALEYECFRAQAMGGGCSVGDQMLPRGILDPAAYRLIGEVYKQVEEAEPFYQDSQPMPDVAILQPGHPSIATGESNLSLEGAVLMCEEAHYDCVVVDDSAELEQFNLLILPDSVIVTEVLKTKLEEYIGKGGRLIATGKSGFSETCEDILADLGRGANGTTPTFPTYWRGRPAIGEEWTDSDRVIYQAGMQYAFDESWEVLVDRVPPYFKRSDYQFCSHFQTPAGPDISDYPAVATNGAVTVFSDPVFKEYRKAGSVFVRKIWEQVMERLIGPPAIGSGMPVSVSVYPMQKGSETIVTLLHYIPVRKAIDIDVIEERQGFTGQVLKLTEPASSIVDWQTGEMLEKISQVEWLLPAKSGRLLLQIKPE